MNRKQKRLELCLSLVGEVEIILDVNSIQKPNRCISKDGSCVGYYSRLSDYNENDDTFGVGYLQRVNSSMVSNVAQFDVVTKIDLKIGEILELAFSVGRS